MLEGRRGDGQVSEHGGMWADRTHHICVYVFMYASMHAKHTEHALTHMRTCSDGQKTDDGDAMREQGVGASDASDHVWTFEAKISWDDFIHLLHDEVYQEKLKSLPVHRA